MKLSFQKIINYLDNQIQTLITGKAPVNHASSDATYGIGTGGVFGHVKIQSGDINGTTNTDGIAVGLGHTHSQYLTAHQDISGKAPNNHASTGTGYGVATTAAYGHVKIQTGDMNGTANTNGVAAGLGHTHSNYAASSHTHAYAPTAHASSATSYGIGTTAAYGHVKIQSGDMNGTTNTNGIAAGLGHTHSQYLTAHQDISGKAPTNHASTGTGYGVGNASYYGHVKLSDTYASNVGAAANAIGASQSALYSAYAALYKQTAKYADTIANLKAALANTGGLCICVALKDAVTQALTGISASGIGFGRYYSGSDSAFLVILMPGTPNKKLTSLVYNFTNNTVTNRVYYNFTAY